MSPQFFSKMTRNLAHETLHSALIYLVSMRSDLFLGEGSIGTSVFVEIKKNLPKSGVVRSDMILYTSHQEAEIKRFRFVKKLFNPLFYDVDILNLVRVMGYLVMDS